MGTKIMFLCVKSWQWVNIRLADTIYFRPKQREDVGETYQEKRGVAGERSLATAGLLWCHEGPLGPGGRAEPCVVKARRENWTDRCGKCEGLACLGPRATKWVVGAATAAEEAWFWDKSLQGHHGNNKNKELVTFSFRNIYINYEDSMDGAESPLTVAQPWRIISCIYFCLNVFITPSLTDTISVFILLMTQKLD